jgi:hypothetical protein
MPVFQNREAARRYALVVLKDQGVEIDESAWDEVDDYAANTRPGWFGNADMYNDGSPRRDCYLYVQGPKSHIVEAKPGVISPEEVDLSRPGTYWRTEPLAADTEHIVPYKGGRAIMWADEFETDDGPVYKLEIVRLELPIPFAEALPEPPSILDDVRYKRIFDVVLDGDVPLMCDLAYGEAELTADFLAIRRGGMEYPLVTGDILTVRNSETGVIHHAVGVGAPLEYVVQIAAYADNPARHNSPVIRVFTPDPLHPGEWITYYSQWSRRWPGPRYTGDPRKLGTIVHAPRWGLRCTVVDSIGGIEVGPMLLSNIRNLIVHYL